jgi:hypothetical protein
MLLSLTIIALFGEQIMAPYPPKMDAQQLVDCRILPGFRPDIIRNLAVGVRCRLEPRGLRCPPGLPKRIDALWGRDLCMSQNAIFGANHPTCSAKYAKTYRQRLFNRTKRPVEAPDGTVTWKWIDIEFSFASRRESLAQILPIIYMGNDFCVYLRKERMYLTRPGRPEMPNGRRLPPKPEMSKGRIR